MSRSLRHRLAVSMVLSLSTFGVVTTAHASLPLRGGPTYTPGAGGVKDVEFSIGFGSPAGLRSAVIEVKSWNAAGNGTGSRPYWFDIDGVVNELGVLGTSGGTTFSRAGAINPAGQSVGYASKYVGSTSYGARGIRWATGTVTPIELGVLSTNATGSANSTASDINAAGTAIGYSDKYDASFNNRGRRAVRWDSFTNQPTELGSLAVPASVNMFYVYARDINDAGVITGVAEKFSGGGVALGERAVRWDANSTNAIELGALGTSPAGLAYSNPYAINSSGTIVGYAEKYDGAGVLRGGRAVRWDAGGTIATELSPSHFKSDGSASSSAIAINDAGVVIGTDVFYGPGDAWMGFKALRWDAGSSTPTPLADLTPAAWGFTESRVMAINEFGYTAGYAERRNAGGASLGDRAVLWSPSGQVIDLNEKINPALGWTLTNAADVSVTGLVVGEGQFDPDGAGGQEAYGRAFLMVVPEAGTYGRGDANLDASINFDDLLLLAQHYGEANASQSYHVGDLNLDGAVNFDDLLALAQQYESGAVIDPSLDSTFSADWALARSMVPEPVSVLSIAMLGILRRTRRD